MTAQREAGPPAVIFDLDGTLVDSSSDLVAAANHCFRSLGLGDLLEPERDASAAFHGGRNMLRLGFDRAARFGEEEVERQYPRLLAAYGDIVDRETRLYPGALEAVAELREAGYRCGICTNKPAALAEMLLVRLGCRDFFSAVVGADTLPVRKPEAEPLLEAARRTGGEATRCCLVGDTVTDRRTARAAERPCILLGFGPGAEEARRQAPEALLGHFDDLPGIVERLAL